jgi:hypothetical protein
MAHMHHIHTAWLLPDITPTVPVPPPPLLPPPPSFVLVMLVILVVLLPWFVLSLCEEKSPSHTLWFMRPIC